MYGRGVSSSLPLSPSSSSPSLLFSFFSSCSSPYSFFLLLVQILWCDMSKIRLETTQNPMYQIKVVHYKKNSLITFLPPSFAKTKNQKEIRGERGGERGRGESSLSILTRQNSFCRLRRQGSGEKDCGVNK